MLLWLSLFGLMPLNRPSISLIICKDLSLHDHFLWKVIWSSTQSIEVKNYWVLFYLSLRPYVCNRLKSESTPCNFLRLFSHSKLLQMLWSSFGENFYPKICHFWETIFPFPLTYLKTLSQLGSPYPHIWKHCLHYPTQHPKAAPKLLLNQQLSLFQNPFQPCTLLHPYLFLYRTNPWLHSHLDKMILYQI